MSDTQTPDLIQLARLLRPQGRNGEMLAEILTDFPERFTERRQVLLVHEHSSTAERPMEVERHWLHKNRIVLKFKGVDSINDAEPLRGAYVTIPAAERVALDDAFYIGDLMGCRLLDMADLPEDAAGVVVGTIVDVQREPKAADLLLVRPGADIDAYQNEILIPFVKAYLLRVNVDAKEVRMRLPAGLLSINAPATPEEELDRDAAVDGEGPV